MVVNILLDEIAKIEKTGTGVDFVQTIPVHDWNAYKNPKEVQTQANTTDTVRGRSVN